MVDTLACVVFFGDFCVRLYRAESKAGFMKWGWIDLIAYVPNLEMLRWGRMVRVLRMIRLLRSFRSVQKAVTIVFQNKMQGSVVSVVFTAFLLVAFSSFSILVCERQSNGNIKTAEDALWWSIATITTVGYGDKYPRSRCARDCWGDHFRATSFTTLARNDRLGQTKSMSDEFHYTFKCPKCGCPTFEEILTGVTQSTTFQRVNCDAGIAEPDYQNTSTEGGEINHYQCQSCGFVLRNERDETINDTQALGRWLETNGQKHADESSG